MEGGWFSGRSGGWGKAHLKVQAVHVPVHTCLAEQVFVV